VEQIKICPQILSTEEMSKLWSAMQAHYRPTAAYQVSVVLIQATKPVKTPLPVLKRNEEDHGPKALAGLVPPFPTIEKLELPNRQISALLGNTLTLTGHHFAGDTGDPQQVTVKVRLTTARLTQPIDLLVPDTDRSDTQITVQLDNDPAKYPAGVYTLAVLVMPNGQSEETRTSNEWPLLLAPTILTIAGQPLQPPPAGPISVARTGVQNDLGDATLNLTCSPEVLPEQRIVLVLGDREIVAEPHPTKTNILSFIARKIKAGAFRLRLRVDGVDSLLVDRSDEKQPKFDESQQVAIT
jgi:hypothetical protein